MTTYKIILLVLGTVTTAATVFCALTSWRPF
jgi:hypothetical protein